MPPQKRGRAGYSGGRGGGRGRGNLAGNGAATDDNDPRKRNNRAVRFESTPSSSFTNGNTAPSRPNREQPVPSNRTTSGRSVDRHTNGKPYGAAATLDQQGWRAPTAISPDEYRGKMSDLFQKLKERRVKERAAAIANGLMSDPDKPTKLADAITLVGTCQDMCAEHERVERIVANEVDECEKTETPTGSPGKRIPFQDHMVKRFNRSSAGKEEELPSDVRPPLILQKTIDYLFNELIQSNRAFPSVQAFIWNRTRAIRVDFSIQHISRLHDLRIAIDCLERIARFHIVSLHQRSLVLEVNEHFSHQQESEQLKNTLLSLSYYYNDSRHKLQSPNEAEFRAYSIVYFLQNQETEQEAQNWPKNILWAPRVQQALKLYAAAGNTTDLQGPLAPKTPQSIAQGHYGRFWKIVGSKEISYLMACTAEIHFNRIRKEALTSIWKSKYRPKATEDWNLDDLVQVLGFDNVEQVRNYCGAHGFRVVNGARGNSYVDFTSISNGIPDPSPPLKQSFSERLVESKRYDRTLTAIINGIPASTATDEGMVEELTAEDSTPSSKQQPESLFVQDDSDEELPSLEELRPTTNGVKSETDSMKPNPFANPFPPTVKRNPFILDDGLDLANDGPSTDTQPSKTTLQPASSNPFISAQPSKSLFGSESTSPANPFAPNSAASRAPAVPPRSNFGLPSGPAVPPATSSNQPSTLFLPPPSAKTEINDKNITDSNQPSNSSPSIFHVPKSQDSSDEPSSTQKSNPFLRTTDSSSIFGAPSSNPNPNPVAAKQPPNPFSPGAKSPFMFGPPPSSPKPVSTTPQQPTNPFPSSNNLTSIFGAPSSSTIPTNTTPQQTESSTFPSELNAPSIFGTPASTTKPIATAPEPPSSFFPASGQSSPFAASQPSNDTFSFLNTKPATDPASSASQPSTNDPGSFESAKDTRINPFPTSFTPQKEAPASSQILFSPPTKSSSINPSKASPFSEDQIAQIPPAAQDQSRNNATPFQQSLTPAIRPSGSSDAVNNSAAQQSATPALSISKPANRTNLEQLSKSVFLDSKGLLEQLTEYTAGPIILEAMRQVEDEKSQKKIDDLCWRIMARRWIGLWKIYAYRRKLARKGRERRRRFAENLPILAQASKRQRAEAEVNEYFNSRQEQLQNSSPPKKARVIKDPYQHTETGRQTRRSLPSDTRRPLESKESVSVGTRQHDHNADTSNNISSNAPTKRPSSHQRSRTHVDPSTLTRSERTPDANTSFGSSLLSRKSLLSNSVLSNARAPVPNGRVDTTRTPYFRLKALGLTPSGYSKPEPSSHGRGTKRSRDEDNEGLEKSKSAKVTRPERDTKVNGIGSRHNASQRERQKSVEPQTTGSGGGKLEDEDEELFAQMRQLKEAMAEDIQLYQEERARSDLSRSVSGGPGKGSREQVKPHRALQGGVVGEGKPREVWRNPPVKVADVAYDEEIEDEDVEDGLEEEGVEEVNGGVYGEEVNRGVYGEEVDGGVYGDEDVADGDELEDEDAEVEQDEEDEEDDEDAEDKEFDEMFEDSDEDDGSESAESEDLADLTIPGTTSSTAFMGGALLNTRRPVNQSTSAVSKGGSSIEDAIEL